MYKKKIKVVVLLHYLLKQIILQNVNGKKNKQNNIKTCCRYLERCVGSKCTKKRESCKIVDKTTKRRSKSCYWKRYKKGRRLRCCKSSTFCKKK